MNIAEMVHVEDMDILERVFLYGIMRKYLTEREHVVMALRNNGYTRSSIVSLLGIGKTTVYACERQAIAKLQKAYLLEMREEEDECTKSMGTTALSAERPSHGDLQSAPRARVSTEPPVPSGPNGCPSSGEIASSSAEETKSTPSEK